MQGNSVLLAKTLEKNFQNHPYGQPVLTFDKRQIRFPVCSLGCGVPQATIPGPLLFLININDCQTVYRSANLGCIQTTPT